MNKSQIMLTTAFVAIFCSTGSAHASMIDVTLGATGSDLSYSSGSNTLNPNLTLGSPGSGLVLNNNAQIVTPAGTVAGQYIQPTGTLFGNNFLAVLGEPSTGLATFTLAPSLNEFAFTWGTIDAYNTLILTDSRNVTYTITGTDILNMIANSVPGTTQSDVTIVDPRGSIVTAELTSSQNAFEAGNFGESDPSPVPLPPALPLFGAALMGLFLYAHRKTA